MTRDHFLRDHAVADHGAVEQSHRGESRDRSALSWVAFPLLALLCWVDPYADREQLRFSLAVIGLCAVLAACAPWPGHWTWRVTGWQEMLINLLRWAVAICLQTAVDRHLPGVVHLAVALAAVLVLWSCPQLIRKAPRPRVLPAPRPSTMLPRVVADPWWRKYY